jgi:hypothetical protein
MIGIKSKPKQEQENSGEYENKNIQQLFEQWMLVQIVSDIL